MPNVREMILYGQVRGYFLNGDEVPAKNSIIQRIESPVWKFMTPDPSLFPSVVLASLTTGKVTVTIKIEDQDFDCNELEDEVIMTIPGKVSVEVKYNTRTRLFPTQNSLKPGLEHEISTTAVPGKTTFFRSTNRDYQPPKLGMILTGDGGGKEHTIVIPEVVMNGDTADDFEKKKIVESGYTLMGRASEFQDYVVYEYTVLTTANIPAFI